MTSSKLQTDFSECMVAESGPMMMALSYLGHLKKRPHLAGKKAVEFGYRAIKYKASSTRGHENLEDVFAGYAGMPVDALDEAASRLTLSQNFLDAVQDYQMSEGVTEVELDIISRDADALVERFLELNEEILDGAGIRISNVYANELEVDGDVLTGKSKIRVTLDIKPSIIDRSVPYIAAKDEERIYRHELSDIIRI